MAIDVAPVASLYDPRNVRYAGRALVFGGGLVGAFLGKAIEGWVCASEPPVARISFVSGAALIVVLDLAYRAAHRKAREEKGGLRFVHPATGGSLIGIPAWVIGCALLVVALVGGFRHGLC